MRKTKSYLSTWHYIIGCCRYRRQRGNLPVLCNLVLRSGVCIVFSLYTTEMALCAPIHKLSIASSLSSGNNARARRTRKNELMIVQMTASWDVAAYEEGQLERPKWAGETPLSRLVAALISVKPIYTVLKSGARQVLIRFPLSLWLHHC